MSLSRSKDLTQKSHRRKWQCHHDIDTEPVLNNILRPFRILLERAHRKQRLCLKDSLNKSLPHFFAFSKLSATTCREETS